jgi:hypothetical protein
MFRNISIGASFITATLLQLASPAVAVDARQAIRLCDKNPRCNFSVDGADGGITVTVGDQLIMCPGRGQCICAACRTSSGSSGVGGVLGTKTPAAAKPGVRPLTSPDRRPVLARVRQGFPASKPNIQPRPLARVDNPALGKRR